MDHTPKCIQYATINPYAIIFMLVCLLLTHKKNDVLTYLPILVKMNITESEMKKNTKEYRLDVFKQVWVGTFDYMFCKHKIVGTVELKCNELFSIAKNNEWLFNENSNVKNIISYINISTP